MKLNTALKPNLQEQVIYINKTKDCPFDIPKMNYTHV